MTWTDASNWPGGRVVAMEQVEFACKQSVLNRTDGDPSHILAIAQIYALIYIGDTLNQLIDQKRRT